ncbi:hypothetical protein DFH06DRAFT_1430742 [Mycena polygramma]|nr:hypothetical protein DFH06DRAFT_1430742 [Mycena polygramma]
MSKNAAIVAVKLGSWWPNSAHGHTDNWSLETRWSLAFISIKSIVTHHAPAYRYRNLPSIEISNWLKMSRVTLGFDLIEILRYAHGPSHSPLTKMHFTSIALSIILATYTCAKTNIGPSMCKNLSGTVPSCTVAAASLEPTYMTATYLCISDAVQNNIELSQDCNEFELLIWNNLTGIWNSFFQFPNGLSQPKQEVIWNNRHTEWGLGTPRGYSILHLGPIPKENCGHANCLVASERSAPVSILLRLDSRSTPKSLLPGTSAFRVMRVAQGTVHGPAKIQIFGTCFEHSKVTKVKSEDCRSIPGVPLTWTPSSNLEYRKSCAPLAHHTREFAPSVPAYNPRCDQCAGGIGITTRAWWCCEELQGRGTHRG